MGRWELRGRWTSEAISTIIELITGGWYSQALVATVRLQYDYNGADLVLVALSPSGKPDSATKTALKVRFDGDTLTATSPRDRIRMLRLYGGDFTGDIKGRWLMLGGDPDAKAIAQEFGADGYLKVITTLSGEVGRYRIIGPEIEWSPMLPSRVPRRTRFKVENDRLKLWAGKSSDELVRLR